MKLKITLPARSLAQPGLRAFLLLLTVTCCTILTAQDVTVRGKVTAFNGEPLVGVNVIVKGTTQGAVSDFDGAYVVTTPANGTLVYSYVGYVTAEEAVNGRSEINVVLEESVSVLDQVMVVGYGTKKRSDLTGSVVSIDASEIREVPEPNPLLAMQGRLAGVEVQRTSNRPGAGTQIRIRGNRSLGTDESGVNDPLIVLDGIPFNGNLNDINPGDIVNINVLKDASATAIYGSRGANGVILVSTKRGSLGRPRLTYNGSYGISSPLGKYKLMDAQRYALTKQVSNFGAPGGFFTATEIENLAAGREIDWQDVVFKDGFNTNHELGVSGGTDMTQYSVSVGYYDETTVLPGQEFERYSIRASLDQKVGKRITVGLSLLNSIANTKGESLSPMFQLLTLSPLYNAYNTDGSINLLPAVGSVDATTVSPLALYNTNAWSEDRRRLRTFNVAYAEVKLFEGLRYRLNAGLDFWQDRVGQFQSANTPFRNGSGSTAAVRNGENWSYTIEHLLLYDKQLGDHNFELTGLFSVQENQFNRSGMDANALFADFIQYYNFSLAESATIPSDPNNPTFQYSKWGLVSYMGRLNYSYKGKYLATLTLRSDGSSRLAEGNKWFTYPAAAVAWNIHHENFFGEDDVLSSLRLRAGWGRTSNQAIAPYSSLGSLARIPYNFGDAGVYGFLVNTLPNAGLSWEFTSSLNAGIDFGLFDNRVFGSIDYYSNKTDNVLQARNVPITAGVPGSYFENIGKTKSNGIEIVLSTDIIRSPGDGFNFGLDLNFAAHNEEIEALTDGVTEDIGNGWFVGHPVNVIYDYRKTGIWQLDEVEEAKKFGDFAPGDIKLADLNGNGTIDAGDREVLGQLDPKWTAGITPRLSFKGFDLSAVAFIRQGGMLISNFYMMNQALPYNTLEGRRNGPDVDYWTPDNPTNEFPRTGRQITPFGSTVGYFDADYMKIRSINLGYTFKSNVYSKAGLEGLRVYVTVFNPFRAIGSDYVDLGGVDPETNGRGVTGQGFGPGGLGRRLTVNADTPPARSVIFGVNVSL